MKKLIGLVVMAIVMLNMGCRTQSGYLQPLMGKESAESWGYVSTHKLDFYPQDQDDLQLFYGTSREREEEELSPFYNWRRAEQISLGVATLGQRHSNSGLQIRVESVEELGHLEPQGISSYFRPQVSDQSPQGFVSSINEELEQRGLSEITVFVHGFNNDFVEPMLMTHALQSYGRDSGLFISYSWPSLGMVTAYGGDLEINRSDQLFFRSFLEMLLQECQAEKIHVVGFSAGTRLVTGALHEISLKRWGQQDGTFLNDKIGRVVLAASDMDLRLFCSYLQDGLMDQVDMLTVYLSSNDLLLGSSEMHHGYPRLGQRVKDKSIWEDFYQDCSDSDRVFFIDASNAENNQANGGHFYFLHSKEVRDDLLKALYSDNLPHERGLLIDREIPMLWGFPLEQLE